MPSRRPPPQGSPSALLLTTSLLAGIAVGCRAERATVDPVPAVSAASRTESVVASARPSPEPSTPPAAASASVTDSVPPPVAGPRVYAKTRNVWIRPKPDSSTQWIGFLWFGTSVKLRSPEPVAGPGCQTWYAIEPRGYVCVEGERATLDPNDEFLKSALPYAPDFDSPTPHRYGESTDLQRYTTLPTEPQQRAREWDYRDRMAALEKARSGEPVSFLEQIDVTPAVASPPELVGMPRTLQMDRTRLKARSTVAWSHEVEHEGRSWLLTADMTWVPKDRVKPYPDVAFRGVHLGRDASLPLAFFRGEDRPKLTRNVDGTFSPTGERFARLSFVELTGKRETVDDVTYLETREEGVYVAQSDAVVPELAKQTPWGAPLEGPDDAKNAPRGRQTWIDATIFGGWLIAYEGKKPVFTTLISPGRGGPPQADKDPVSTASTPVGNFKITGKFATATMVAPGDFVHSDVPWAQNFSGPHALHGAYWHDSWGELKSGGCVNVSPIDGKWLYGFTEPVVPDGWFGVRWLPDSEPATTLIVRR